MEDRRAAWCIEHSDLAWEYPDGSVTCLSACIREISTDECDVRPFGVGVQRTIERFRFIYRHDRKAGR